MHIIEHDWAWAHGLSQRSRTDAIVLHHAAAKTASPEQVHAWHLQNGWAGIGYHLYIRKDGEKDWTRLQAWLMAFYELQK